MITAKKLKKIITALPDTPGVYFFMGKSGTGKAGANKILYIGRATSLRDRVKSYFKDDVIHTRGSLIVDMVTQATDIETIGTDSVLEAIILEANLIKQHLPHYNTMEKDDKSFNYIVITREDFPVIQLVRGKELEEHFPKNRIKHVFGPYPHGLVLREGLKIIRRIFPYRDARCQPAGSAKNPHGKPCFNRQIGLCPGVCTGEISKRDYARIVTGISLFFQGRKRELITKLERQMKAYAKVREFEQANEVKRTIFALTHIQDISLIKEETRVEETAATELSTAIKSEVAGNRLATRTAGIAKPPSRIEAYDVAHMNGQNTVGVMVVLEGGQVKKSDYRLFRIRLSDVRGANGARGQSIVNDVASLKEILNRRLNHPEWPYPHLIVVDGAQAQKNAAEEILRERGFDIAVVAVVKDQRHRPDRILGDAGLTKKHSREILLLNSEAHRFAIKYHRKLRSSAYAR